MRSAFCFGFLLAAFGFCVGCAEPETTLDTDAGVESPDYEQEMMDTAEPAMEEPSFESTPAEPEEGAPFETEPALEAPAEEAPGEEAGTEEEAAPEETDAP